MTRMPYFAILLLALLTTGCATTTKTATTPQQPDSTTRCESPYEMADPWEPFNRAVYRFNARFDEAIFLPVSRGYRQVLPGPVRTGIHNFFRNLGEVGNVLNHGLQGQAGRSLRSLGRFAMNTTLGIAGLFDVATPMGLERQATGFGDTLARWGTAPGPYLVLPVLGPSSLRDGGGLLVDAATAYTVDMGGLYQSEHAWMLNTLNAVDTRANVNFRYYASGSPFEYEMVRFLYSNKRMIESGVTGPDLLACK